jgi:hypothetical protein
MVDLINGTHTTELDEDWMRCEVDLSQRTFEIAGEEIAQKVANEGGKIRLLHPASVSLESTYLRLIREAELQQ